MEAYGDWLFKNRRIVANNEAQLAKKRSNIVELAKAIQNLVVEVAGGDGRRLAASGDSWPQSLKAARDGQSQTLVVADDKNQSQRLVTSGDGRN